LAALFRRLAKHRGRNQAIFAVGHAIPVIIFQIWKSRQPYRDPGDDFFDQCDKARTSWVLVRRLV
jgi:hypothetical protein